MKSMPAFFFIFERPWETLNETALYDDPAQLYDTLAWNIKRLTLSSAARFSALFHQRLLCFRDFFYDMTPLLRGHRRD